MREIPLIGVLTLCWLAPAGLTTASAQSTDGSVMIVEVWAPAGQVDTAAVQEAIARELGVVAISPWDPRAPSSRGTIRVRIDAGKLEVEYEERHTIHRQIVAPTGVEAQERAAAFLAGNLARQEASDIASWLAPRAEAKRWPVPASADVPSPEPDAVPKQQAEQHRVWLGVAAEVDASSFDGSYFVVESDGTPVSFTAPGPGPSGLGVNTRVLFDFDFEMSDHTLIGGRAGIMTRRYPGPMGSGLNVDGIHLEAHATWIMGAIGSDLSPYLSAGVGAANFDAEQDIPPFEAWKSHGPAFVAAGFGAQIPLFRGFAAMVMPLQLTLSFPNDTALIWSPEVSMRVGL